MASHPCILPPQKGTDTTCSTSNSNISINQSINQSIKTNIFPCLLKRCSNIHYSTTMNIYLHICDKLSLHFTDKQNRPITTSSNLTSTFLYNNIYLAIQKVSFVWIKKNYPGVSKNIKGQGYATNLGYWRCTATCYDHYYRIRGYRNLIVVLEILSKIFPSTK